MKTLAERLKFSREKAGLTQQQVAEKTGMSQPTYFKVEKGVTKRTTYLAELANLFNVSSTWLATGQGEMVVNSGIYVGGNNSNHGNQIVGDQTNIHNNIRPATAKKTAPLINWVQAGSFVEIGDDVYDEYLPYFGDYGDDNVYWLRIVGTSMIPDFKEGEYVLINRDRQPVAGNYVVAMQQGEKQATFKKYRPKGFDDKGVEYFHLVPSNEEYPIIDSRYQPFEVVGVAVERNQKLI